MPSLFLSLFLNALMPKILTRGFVFLQLSSSTSCLCKRPAVEETVAHLQTAQRCSGHLHCVKDQPRKDKDYVQGMLKQTHLVVLFCFSFHFVSNPPLSGHHHHLTIVDPLHSASTPPGARLHSPHGVRNGGEGVAAHQVRVDPSLPTATSFSHAITGPAMPKVLDSGRG